MSRSDMLAQPARTGKQVFQAAYAAMSTAPVTGEEQVHYSIDAKGVQGPFTIDVQLWYQSIAHRWKENLKPHTSAEPQRFVSYYEQMASGAGLMLTRGTRIVEP